jgi:ATP-dependent DNA helicase RecQ
MKRAHETSATTDKHGAAQIQQVLKRVFRLKRLRSGQLEVVQRVLDGVNTLAVMPTGAGKSLCYQLPAMMLDSTTVVVSPLVALMKDQCDYLCDHGIAAVQINSAVPAEELARAREAVKNGSARIVLTTPEQMADPELLAMLDERKVSLLVVDEAHCISQWGHDFRPAFLGIAAAVKPLGRPAVLALTATAKPAVMEEIMQQFDIAQDDVVHGDAYRPNLHLSVEQVGRAADRMDRAMALVASSEGSGIVYAATVKSAEELHDKLAAAGESVALYHGRLPVARRAEAQDAFMAGQVRVMVATNAFGLGIDKPDIRFVVHLQMPSSLDAYYQEAGRAGRDGADAACTLLYLRQDRALQQFFMAGRYPTLGDVQAVYATLCSDNTEGGWTSSTLERVLDRPRSKLQVALSLLRQHKAVRCSTEGVLTVPRRALSTDALEQMLTAYQRRREEDQRTLETMVAYAQSGRCRWHAVLDYLGDSPSFDACGRCDNCLRVAKLTALMPGQPLTPATIETVPEVPRVVFNGGDVVTARRYGRGQVVQADATAVTVLFPNGTQRTFLPDFVRAARGSAPRLGNARLSA